MRELVKATKRTPRSFKPKVEIPTSSDPSVGYRKIKIKIDGEFFDSLEKVSVYPEDIHQQVLHYQRTTTCGLVVTKKMQTATQPKELTCIDCLNKLAIKKRAELKLLEDEIKFQRTKKK